MGRYCLSIPFYTIIAHLYKINVCQNLPLETRSIFFVYDKTWLYDFFYLFFINLGQRWLIFYLSFYFFTFQDWAVGSDFPFPLYNWEHKKIRRKKNPWTRKVPPKHKHFLFYPQTKRKWRLLRLRKSCCVIVGSLRCAFLLCRHKPSKRCTGKLLKHFRRAHVL